jgi:hypothetical protein
MMTGYTKWLAVKDVEQGEPISMTGFVVAHIAAIKQDIYSRSVLQVKLLYIYTV